MLNMAKLEKSSKMAEAESNVRLVSLMERMNKLTMKEEVQKNENIVAVLGPTKSGKSTLINGLLGNELMCKIDDETGKISLTKAPGMRGPGIGNGPESKTVEPECYQNVPGLLFALWDFAGFGDTGGTEQQLVNALSYLMILCPQNSIRFVLVVPYYFISDDNPFTLYKLLNELLQICPQVADSLCIVSTKAERGTVKGLLERVISHQHRNKSNMDMIDNAKRVIGRVLFNRTYMDFKAPVLAGGVAEVEFTLPNKQQFIDCINSLKGAQVSNFPLVISDEAKFEIAEFYTIYYQAVKKDVHTMCISIETYIQRRIDEILVAESEDGQVSASSRLAILKSGKDTLVTVMCKSTNFKEFFPEIEKAGWGLMTKGFSENIEKFLFVEKLRNMYKMNSTEGSVKGELEFFSNVKEALGHGAKKYSDLIASSEAATREEKRRELEWQQWHIDEMSDLKDQIKRLKKYNDSLLVQGAIWLAETVVPEKCVIA